MLKLVKRPNSPYWIARGTIDGRRIERSTGESDKAAAKRALTGIIAELTAAAIDPETGITFAQAAALYLDHKPRARSIDRLILHFGDMPVADIRNAEMRRAANMIFTNAAPATIRRQLYTPVKAILNLAAEDELCQPPRFKSPAGGAKRTVFIMPDEGNRIIEALGADPNPHMAVIATFLLGQGSRVGETLALDGRDVSLEGKFAILRDTKNGEERRVTLTARTVAALSTLPTVGKAGPVFRRKDGSRFPMSDSYGGQIKYAVRRAVDRAGLDPARVTPHIFRHSWATWFYAQTRDVVRLAHEGGWKSQEWQRYVKLATPDLGEIARAEGWVFCPETGETRGRSRARA
ncbi:MAG: site-specific integrase [Notoacmeibacter sp.]|nr:site-specific integrase [Notoacmeibacter sp.]